MPMHSISESEYAAVNEWLNSIGDDEESDFDPGESTVASSPAGSVNSRPNRRTSLRISRTMHAGSFGSSRGDAMHVPGASSKRVIGKSSVKPELPDWANEDVVVDRRMKGDVC